MNINTMLRMHYMHRLMQWHFKSMQCSISHNILLHIYIYCRSFCFKLAIQALKNEKKKNNLISRKINL